MFESINVSTNVIRFGFTYKNNLRKKIKTEYDIRRIIVEQVNHAFIHITSIRSSHFCTRQRYNNFSVKISYFAL